MGQWVLSEVDGSSPVTITEEEGKYNWINISRRISMEEVIAGENVVFDYGVFESDRAIEIDGGDLFPISFALIAALDAKYKKKPPTTYHLLDSVGNKWEVAFFDFRAQKKEGMEYYTYHCTFRPLQQLLSAEPPPGGIS